MILLFDAANTLIHKPSFYENFVQTLSEFDITIGMNELKKNHTLIAECYSFPDRTNKLFYHEFNKSVLYSLGIIASDELLERLYKNCSYLPWEKFEDANYLNNLPLKKVVLSNFHSDLNHILDKHFPGVFSEIFSSENEQLRKPDTNFFLSALKKLNVPASEILYFGDSLKLDIEPALKLGMNAWLIDRNNYYPYCKNSISSFQEIKNLI